MRTFPSFLRNHGTGDSFGKLWTLRQAQDDNSRTFSVSRLGRGLGTGLLCFRGSCASGHHRLRYATAGD